MMTIVTSDKKGESKKNYIGTDKYLVDSTDKSSHSETKTGYLWHAAIEYCVKIKSNGLGPYFILTGLKKAGIFNLIRIIILGVYTQRVKAYTGLLCKPSNE